MIQRRKAPQHLADLVTTLVAPACRKRGVANAALLLDPAELFGERLAKLCAVERISWPRGSRIDRTDSTGATLVVEARSGSALTLQHVAPQVIERANLIIGWPAISRLRIVQAGRRRDATQMRETTAKPLDGATISAIEAELPPLSDQKLKTALARLGASVRERGLSAGRKEP